jgi:hypothetical protein
MLRQATSIIEVALWINTAATASQQANAENNERLHNGANSTNTSNHANFTPVQTVSYTSEATADMRGESVEHTGGMDGLDIYDVKATKTIIIYSSLVEKIGDPHNRWIEVVEATTENGVTTSVGKYVDYYGKIAGENVGSARFNYFVNNMSAYGKKFGNFKTEKDLKKLNSFMARMQTASLLPFGAYGSGTIPGWLKAIQRVGILGGTTWTYQKGVAELSAKLQPIDALIHSVEMFDQFGNPVYDLVKKQAEFAKQKRETLDMYWGIPSFVQQGLDYFINFFIK